MCLKVLCVNLLDIAVENITGGLREHQQVKRNLTILKYDHLLLDNLIIIYYICSMFFSGSGMCHGAAGPAD